jgi:hypothetical protein
MAQRAAPPPLAHSRAGIVYLVLDDFGDGCAYRETDAAQADPKTVVADLLSGQYRHPLRRPALRSSSRDAAHPLSRQQADYW